MHYYEYQGEGVRCNGKIYKEDELGALIDLEIRRLRNMTRNETEEHTKVYEPESLVYHRRKF